VAQAAAVGLRTIALTDHGGFYGSARLHAAAQKHGIRALVGTTIHINKAGDFPVIARNRRGYQALCRMHTNNNLGVELPPDWQAGDLVCLTGSADERLVQLLEKQNWKAAKQCVQHLINHFGAPHVYVEITRHHTRNSRYIESALTELAEHFKLQQIASNAPLYARRSDRLLADAFTCLREHTILDKAGQILAYNSERHIKPPNQIQQLFADRIDLLVNTERLAQSLDFTLENLGYQFPRYRQNDNGDERYLTADEEVVMLREQSYAGAAKRYDKVTAEVKKQLDHELHLIAQLGFSGYFLIVWDIVRWAQNQGMLCQGRGSAANSVVCYALGITNADPVGGGLLFERFLSKDRKSWPDIDVDFPSGERRESVIQYVYDRYAPRGAAMTANVITYRKRSAFREMAKVLGFGDNIADQFSKTTVHQELVEGDVWNEALVRCGVEHNHPRLAALQHLFFAVKGKPRHLGQHPGGMVICDAGLDSLVPLEPATMPGRTILQWDKNDCESLGLVKVDLLGLGMLAAMEDMLRISRERGKPVDIAQIPKDDTATYDLLCAADTVGTFQVESRAQMNTLPIMKPRCFYDVVVEVALIRPGPIVGNLVHPYLNRRNGRAPIESIHPLFDELLERTLGVPMFQEQVLKMAMLIADFSGTEAEELRKAMSFERSHEKMQQVTAKLKIAMTERGVTPEVQNQVIESIGSFSQYGFPESHAISFGLIAYASCWLKVHRTAEFFTGLLNNQPMGFYSPSSLLYDARRHGIRVKPVCVQQSNIETTVLDDKTIRLGLLHIKGLSQELQLRVVESRSHARFTNLEDFMLRTRPNKKERRAIAAAGALNGLDNVSHRRSALWQAEASLNEDDLFYQAEQKEIKTVADTTPLAPMNRWERLNADYDTQGLTTGAHPMQVWRRQVDPTCSYYRAADLFNVPHGQSVYLTGMVICRQRPTTGKGHCFLSMEDETGISNLFIPRPTFEKYRLLISTEAFLLAFGRVQINEGGSRSLYVLTVSPLPDSPQEVRIKSHDYC